MEPNLAMRNLFKYLAFVGVSLASLYTLSTSSIYTNRRQEEAIPPDEIFIGKARSKIAVVTRVHGSFATNMPDKEKIKSFVKAARVYSSKIIICIDLGKDMSNSGYISLLKESFSELPTNEEYDVDIVPVSPWGRFVPALNAALVKCLEAEIDFVVFQSVEFRVSEVVFVQLLRQASMPATLVAGPAMAGHEFSPGLHDVRGRTCPWNTFAIWNAHQLALTGFPMVAEGMGEDWGGVEEVSAVNLQQHLFPGLRAVLVGGAGESESEWNTTFEGDPKRREWHEKKMRSKDERPARQMGLMGQLAAGSVTHVLPR